MKAVEEDSCQFWIGVQSAPDFGVEHLCLGLDFFWLGLWFGSLSFALSGFQKSLSRGSRLSPRPQDLLNPQ